MLAGTGGPTLALKVAEPMTSASRCATPARQRISPVESNSPTRGNVERWAHYDITTGYNLIDPSRKLKRYPITVEAGNLVVELV
jgi:hypothetical protein